MTKKMISDLPYDLIGEKILSKVPITSLREVRSTCKLWNRLTKDWILGKEAIRQHQFLGFMTMDFKVCSLRFHLHRKEEKEEEEEDSVDLSIKQVCLLNQIEIKSVFHCDGLLLCIAMDNSKLVVWNPYLGQTRTISLRTDFDTLSLRTDFDTHFNYLFGYDMNRNHKILRFSNYICRHCLFEIYDFSFNSWRVLEVIPDWKVELHHRGVSLKGNTYLWAHEKMEDCVWIDDWEDFLLCFDFTTEKFGPHLPLPVHSFCETTVTLSSVRDEKLALLHQKGRGRIKALEIWITTKIEPNVVTWNKFMNVDMRPLIGDSFVQFHWSYGSFFIEEEEKVAVVFDMDGYEHTKTAHYHTAFIIGDDGYYNTVSLGEAPNTWKPPYPGYSGYTRQIYCPPLVCSSSYFPSLVQLKPTAQK